MVGPTVFLPPDASPAENNKKFLDADAGQSDTFTIDGTKVRPKGAPYAVEMLVARIEEGKKPGPAAFRPRNLETRDGLPFLRVEPGEAVAVRIINDADHDVASTVTLTA